MGINPTAVQAGTTVPVLYYQRYPQTPLRPSVLTSPVAPEDIVDYVELESNGKQSSGKFKTVYGASDDTRKTIGTLIDVWI
jgi:hypothetical protein